MDGIANLQTLQVKDFADLAEIFAKCGGGELPLRPLKMHVCVLKIEWSYNIMERENMQWFFFHNQIFILFLKHPFQKIVELHSTLVKIRYRKLFQKTGFRSIKSWHCAYIIYSVKTWFLKKDTLAEGTFFRKYTVLKCYLMASLITWIIQYIKSHLNPDKWSSWEIRAPNILKHSILLGLTQTNDVRSLKWHR